MKFEYDKIKDNPFTNEPIHNGEPNIVGPEKLMAQKQPTIVENQENDFSFIPFIVWFDLWGNAFS